MTGLGRKLKSSNKRSCGLPRDFAGRSGLQPACDELIDKGAIHHRRIVGCMRPELGEFIR
jgi:hypothetical protein